MNYEEYEPDQYWYISMSKLSIIGAILVSLTLIFVLYKFSANIQIAEAVALPTSTAPSQNLSGATVKISPKKQENLDETSSITGDCQVSDRFPQRVHQWCALITSYANQRNLDPDLLAALILQESAGDPSAYSHSGAVGLMQVMPRDGIAANFSCQNGPCFKNRPSSAELQEPEFNVSYGSKMLAGLIKRTGNIRDALKSYGPMDVGYYYSDRVLSLYEKYRD